MKSEERIEIILDELNRIRYGFELIEDDYREARIDVATEEIENIEERISEFRSAGIWPPEEELDDLTSYQNNLIEEEE
jgi:hypothetical protein